MGSKENKKINWPIIGNKHITLFFDKLVSSNNIQGNFIFNGPEDIGKTSVALFFMKILFCKSPDYGACDVCDSCLRINNFIANKSKESAMVHPDVSIIQREEDKKNISIEQIRVLIKSLNMSSFFNSYKIGIIRDAESLSIEASNALLKTLEEPKNKVLVFLITSDIDKLPKTIISRCQVLNFHSVDSKTIYDYLVENFKAPRDKARDISKLCFGRPALAIKYLEDNDRFYKYLNDIRIFIDFFSAGISERFSAIEANLGVGSGQAAAQKSKIILKNWQGVVRDMILYEVGQSKPAYEVDIESILKKRKEKNSLRYLLDINKAIDYSIECIDSNVNPKIVLNNLALSI